MSATIVPSKRDTLLAMLVLASILLAACGPQGTPGQVLPTAAPTSTTGSRPSSTPRRTPTAVAGKPGTALEWYPVAAQAAQGWQADAVVSSAVGGNTASDGGTLPCDGKAELWSYSFLSVATQKTLTVYVRGGAVASQKESDLTYMGSTPPLPAPVLEYYSGLYAASDWKVDSTDAAQATNALFKGKYNVEPGTISYVMFNSKYQDAVRNTTTNWMRWVISYDPEKHPFQVTLDARSGEVKSRP